MSKLSLSDNPIERTTAATDALLVGVALAGLIYLQAVGQAAPWKTNLWSGVLLCLALAAGLGAIAHGIELSETRRQQVWQPLNLALGLLVSLFVIGVAYDLWGQSTAQRLLPWLIASGLAFFGVTLLRPGTFLLFISYQSVAMLFALVAYGRLATTGQVAGAWLMVGGVLLTMIAAGVQAGRVGSFTLIWPFDHNGLYHLLQTVAVVILLAGLRAG
jgi:hypothetical protein